MNTYNALNIRIKREEKRELSNVKILLAASIITFFVLIALFLVPARKVNASVSNADAKYRITSIVIEKGDTLWDLAKEYYTSDFSSIKEYIKEIKRLNGLKNDNITAGNYLLIPHYTR